MGSRWSGSKRSPVWLTYASGRPAFHLLALIRLGEDVEPLGCSFALKASMTSWAVVLNRCGF
jgi:hypothetical protein